MKVFFNALIVHLIFNVYVFVWGWKILPPKKTYRIPYTSLFVIEFFIYLTGFFSHSFLPLDIFKPIALIGTSWMILIGYISAFLLLYDVLKYLDKKIKALKKLKLDNLKRKRLYFIFSCLFVFCVMGYGSYCFHNPVVSEYNLSIDKKAGNLDKLRVVMVSDIHVGALIDKGILNMYVDRIMEQKPDIILLAGDIIDYDLPPLTEERMDEEFRRLQAPYGVFASTGNHEYRLNAEEKIAWLGEKAGMTVLRDSVVKIADGLYIAGREDDHCPVRKDLKDIIRGIDKELPVIVINHEPKKLQEEADENIDLALYGHTHNGQLFPYNLIINLIYEVGYGYKKKENTHVYVSSGLGLAGPQYRIGTKSEIVVLNLTFKKQ